MHRSQASSNDFAAPSAAAAASWWKEWLRRLAAASVIQQLPFSKFSGIANSGTGFPLGRLPDKTTDVHTEILMKNGKRDGLGHLFSRGFEHFLNDATTEAPLPDNDASRTIEMFRRALPELLTLDRYVRRAFSRRKFAIRALCAHTG
jgi:hypothetical protein